MNSQLREWVKPALKQMAPGLVLLVMVVLGILSTSKGLDRPQLFGKEPKYHTTAHFTAINMDDNLCIDKVIHIEHDLYGWQKKLLQVDDLAVHMASIEDDRKASDHYLSNYDKAGKYSTRRVTEVLADLMSTVRDSFSTPTVKHKLYVLKANEKQMFFPFPIITDQGSVFYFVNNKTKSKHVISSLLTIALSEYYLGQTEVAIKEQVLAANMPDFINADFIKESFRSSRRVLARKDYFLKDRGALILLSKTDVSPTVLVDIYKELSSHLDQPEKEIESVRLSTHKLSWSNRVSCLNQYLETIEIKHNK